MYVTNMKEKSEIIDFKLMVDDTKANLAFTDNIEHIRFVVSINQTRDFHSDSRFLVFIIQNLLENAVKYSNRWESLVKVNVNEDDRGVIIEVIDNGIGIDAEFHEKIFDMFFRATNFSKGSGLGLYIVKHAVEKLKGKIEMQSEKRVGTVFKVFLPDLKRKNHIEKNMENLNVLNGVNN
jgi:signal transduction histidine kinase